MEKLDESLKWLLMYVTYARLTIMIKTALNVQNESNKDDN